MGVESDTASMGSGGTARAAQPRDWHGTVEGWSAVKGGSAWPEDWDGGWVVTSRTGGWRAVVKGFVVVSWKEEVVSRVRWRQGRPKRWWGGQRRWGGRGMGFDGVGGGEVMGTVKAVGHRASVMGSQPTGGRLKRWWFGSSSNRVWRPTRLRATVVVNGEQGKGVRDGDRARNREEKGWPALGRKVVDSGGGWWLDGGVEAAHRGCR